MKETDPQWLEDFEEGLYIPFPDGADPTIRYNVNVRFIKVGDLVEIYYVVVPLTWWKRAWIFCVRKWRTGRRLVWTMARGGVRDV